MMQWCLSKLSLKGVVPFPKYFLMQKVLVGLKFVSRLSLCVISRPAVLSGPRAPHRAQLSQGSVPCPGAPNSPPGRASLAQFNHLLHPSNTPNICPLRRGFSGARFARWDLRTSWALAAFRGAGWGGELSCFPRIAHASSANSHPVSLHSADSPRRAAVPGSVRELRAGWAPRGRPAAADNAGQPRPALCPAPQAEPWPRPPCSSPCSPPLAPTHRHRARGGGDEDADHHLHLMSRAAAAATGPNGTGRCGWGNTAPPHRTGPELEPPRCTPQRPAPAAADPLGRAGSGASLTGGSDNGKRRERWGRRAGADGRCSSPRAGQRSRAGSVRAASCRVPSARGCPVGQGGPRAWWTTSLTSAPPPSGLFLPHSPAYLAAPRPPASSRATTSPSLRRGPAPLAAIYPGKGEENGAFLAEWAKGTTQRRRVAGQEGSATSNISKELNSSVCFLSLV